MRTPLLSLAFTCILIAAGEEINLEVANPFLNPHRLDKAKLNSELPKHVVAADGKLSLFADFANATPESVPVYLINNTGKTVKLQSQDGDFYVKLEHEASPGKWERAQTHVFGWCGNSYSDRELLNGTHIQIGGYVPKIAPEKVQVRYSLYLFDQFISSNAGPGLVAAKDIKLAANDALSISNSSFERVRALATGELKIKNEVDQNDLRESAIYWLGSGKLDRDASAKVLQSIIDTKDPQYSESAKSALEKLNEKKK